MTRPVEARIKGIARRLLFASVLFASIVAAATTRAAIIEYQLSPDATMTDNGLVLSLSGVFDFDTTTSLVTAATITATLGAASETFSTLVDRPICLDTAESLCVANAVPNDSLGIAFSQSLALDAVDPLAFFGGPGLGSIGFTGCTCTALDPTLTQAASAVTGSADPVPEPTTLALLGTALAALGVVRRRRA